MLSSSASEFFSRKRILGQISTATAVPHFCGAVVRWRSLARSAARSCAHFSHFSSSSFASFASARSSPLGTMPTTYTIEHAKSGRSSCKTKACGQKIDKGEVSFWHREWESWLPDPACGRTSKILLCGQGLCWPGNHQCNDVCGELAAWYTIVSLESRRLE